MLLKENDLFLADDRIIPLLPKLLGSKWFEAKKCVLNSLLNFFSSINKILDNRSLFA